MKPGLKLWSLAVGIALAACHPAPPDVPNVPPEQVPGVTGQAEASFEATLQQVARHDRAGDWSPAICAELGRAFEGAEKKLKSVKDPRAVAARYNQAIALSRCKQTAQARTIFEELLAADPKMSRARVQVALYRLAADGRAGLDVAIREVDRAVRDAQFQNTEALVYLAMLQMRRGKSDADGDDYDRAKLNLQRALAIDDGFMPAYNQLALFYLQSAKRSAGRSRAHLATATQRLERVDVAALELASLVCSQALRKAPGYAPIHNSSGLISAELGDLSAAARAFDRARKLDSRFFEAHMNYAAVNLQFRGFKNAQRAYEVALKLRKDDYDARLGLALALRGQIPKGDQKALVAASMRHLHSAKQLQKSRPEAYFNEAILVQEFRAARGPNAKPMLLKAKGLFAAFIEKTDGKPHYRHAVTQATERMRDIDQILTMLEEQP